MLNNLNRGLGLPDAYPFVLSQPAIEKLRFVHDVIAARAATAAPAPPPIEQPIRRRSDISATPRAPTLASSPTRL